MKKTKQKTATYNLTAEQIEAIKQECIKVAKEESFIELFALSVRVIHDKYPLLMKKEKRTETFAELLLETWKDYQDGLYTLEQLREMLQEETGLRFTNFTKSRLYK